MTFEQFLEAYGLEEYLKSVFEEEPVHNCESTKDLF